MATKYPAIPDPVTNVDSLRDTAISMKETVEILTRQRGNRATSAVTWEDLLALGLCSAAQVPKTPTSQ